MTSSLGLCDVAGFMVFFPLNFDHLFPERKKCSKFSGICV